MIIDIKDLRGYKQPGFIPGWIAWTKCLAANNMLYLSEVLSYTRHRADEADQIAWVNAMPDTLYRALDPIAMHIAFEHRNPSIYKCNFLEQLLDNSPRYFGTGPYWYAKKLERSKRRDDIQKQWEVRKAARALSAATPPADAPARATRL